MRAGACPPLVMRYRFGVCVRVRLLCVCVLSVTIHVRGRNIGNTLHKSHALGHSYVVHRYLRVSHRLYRRWTLPCCAQPFGLPCHVQCENTS